MYGELFFLTINLIGSVVALSFGALVPVLIKIGVCALVLYALRKQLKQYLVPYIIVQVWTHPGLPCTHSCRYSSFSCYCSCAR